MTKIFLLATSQREQVIQAGGIVAPAVGLNTNSGIIPIILKKKDKMITWFLRIHELLFCLSSITRLKRHPLPSPLITLYPAFILLTIMCCFYPSTSQ